LNHFNISFRFPFSISMFIRQLTFKLPIAKWLIIYFLFGLSIVVMPQTFFFQRFFWEISSNQRFLCIFFHLFDSIKYFALCFT
jgi:hypothetical protein